MSHILVTDIDNTLYDYVDFFGPSFRSMVHVLASDFGVKEDALYDEFRELFQDIGTFDYQFLIARLSYSKDLAPERLEKQITRGRQAWDRTKAKRLRAYPGVLDTLNRLRSGGVKIVAVTNAPYYHAYCRLRDIGALKYMSGFVCWQGNYPQEEEDLARFQNVRSDLVRDFELCKILRKSEIKPSTVPFEQVVNFFGPKHSYYAIGDSLHKDLLPAEQLRMKTIWARYGARVDSKNLDTLLRITPWSDQELKQQINGDFKADYEVDSFEALVDIVPYSKTYLFQQDLF